MKTIHILLWQHPLEQRFGIELGGQRQLEQDSVHLRICIQLVDALLHLLLGYIYRQLVMK